METRFHPFERSLRQGRPAAPDFRALVALHAAAQAALPTARLATRLEAGAGRMAEAVEALVSMFAPQRGCTVAAAALAGSFNPAVPFSYAPLTPSKPW